MDDCGALHCRGDLAPRRQRVGLQGCERPTLDTEPVKEEQHSTMGRGMGDGFGKIGELAFRHRAVMTKCDDAVAKVGIDLDHVD